MQRIERKEKIKNINSTDNLFRFIFICLTLISGKSYPDVYPLGFLVENISAADYIKPFYEFSVPVFTLSCERLYGLNDLFSASAATGFPFKRTNIVLTTTAMDVAEVYRKYLLGVRAYYSGRKSYWLFGIKKNIESFGNDSRNYSTNEIQVASGYRFRKTFQPFIGVDADLRHRIFLPNIGFLIKSGNYSRIIVCVKKQTSAPNRLVLSHYLRLHPYFAIHWILQNYPVTFETGFSFSFSKKGFVFTNYKTHHSLGASFQTGAFLYKTNAKRTITAKVVKNLFTETKCD